MTSWRNPSGRPLSSSEWLEAHHRAKLPERKRFARTILEGSPTRLVDLGCGPGLWLEVLNELAPPRCELIGIDSDPSAIKEARRRAESWKRPIEFLEINIDEKVDQLPHADVYLAFNIFPYILRPELVLNAIKSRLRPNGSLLIRQYDGALLRFGPLDQTSRLRLDTSLQTSLLASTQFRHFDLDRVFEIVSASEFKRKEIEFELFQRIAPYPPEFVEYLKNTIDWTIDHTADDISEKLAHTIDLSIKSNFTMPSYFVEVDLVARLS